MTIGNGTVCYYPVSASPCAAPTSANTLTSLNTNGAVTITGGLNAGASSTVIVTTKLDSTATNADQGLQATQGFTWTINQ